LVRRADPDFIVLTGNHNEQRIASVADHATVGQNGDITRR
jgi:hypothetical protein